MSKLKCVYALEMSNATVKIGMSQNVKQRISAITTASGLAVLNCYNTKMLAEEIARTIEKACHETFSAYRIKGEFFNIAFSDACETLKNLVTEYELKNNGVQIFNHEKFGRIRTILIDGEIWFVAVDVCRALDLTNPTMALRKLDDDEKMKIPENRITTEPNYCEGSTVTPFVENDNPFLHEVTIVNEPGLYRLIFQSRKKEAKEFQRVVYHEILPQIRKYGYYGTPNLDYKDMQIVKETDEDYIKTSAFTGEETDIESPCDFYVQHGDLRILYRYVFRVRTCYEPYVYFPKYYKGKLVFTVKDLRAFLNVSEGVLSTAIKHLQKDNPNFKPRLLLRGDEMKVFKAENSAVPVQCTNLSVFSFDTAISIFEYFNVKFPDELKNI